VNGIAGGATAIAAGTNHTCAIQVGTRAVVCWGDPDSYRPTPPPGVNGVGGTAIALESGFQFILAIQAPEPSAALCSVAALALLFMLARKDQRFR
jgi:hypothetical protein